MDPTVSQGSEGRTDALAALLAAEDAGIQNDGQTSLALVGIIAAYMPVSLFAVYQGYGANVLAWLPYPVVLLMFFQMLQTAATTRRARSAEIVERELIAEAGLLGAYEQGIVGSPARSLITNPYAIVKQKGNRWVSRYIASVLPSIGLYGIGVAYTWYLCLEASHLNADYPARSWTVITPVLGLLALWAVFADTAMSYFAPRYRINVWIIVAGLFGIWLQAAQPEDPTPAWVYFSVHSAALITVAAILRPFRLRFQPVIARAGLAGILLVTLLFWAVIFPEQGWGEHESAVWANLFMHVVAPIMTLVATWLERRETPRLSWRGILATWVFPVFYLVLVLTMNRLIGSPIPYWFLNPEWGSLGTTILTCVGTLLFFTVVGGWERWTGLRRR